MEASTSSKMEPAQQANVKCTLFVEELLSIEGLRQGPSCSSCLLGIGTHARQSSGYRTTSTTFDNHSQIGLTSRKQETNENQGVQLTTSIDASISSPDYDKQSKHPLSLSSRSTSSSSVRSLDSNNANLRINVTPITPDTEATKQTAAIEGQLKTAALVEASKLRTKKIKLFLAKYYCPQAGTDPERIYERIFESLKCGKRRLYYLTQHARHNCLSLFQFINTEDGVVQLFQVLNEIIPLENQ